MRAAGSVARQHAAQVAALAAWLSTGAGAVGCARHPHAEPGPSQPPDAVTTVTAPARESGAPAPVVSQAAPVASLLVSDSEYQGWRYFHVYCARCHGQDATGSLDAADLRHSVTEEGGVTADSFMVVVRNGSENKEMPHFHDLLEDEQIRHVYAYIRARSDGRLVAGRPRRSTAP